MLFIGLASTALFVACGDETSCATDTDCASNEVCVNETCTATCTSAADCLEGEVCNTSGTVGICEAGNPTTNNDTNNNTTTADPVYVALIRDKTMGAGCNNNNPGSDIVYVALEDEIGTKLGYAILDYDGIIEDDNTYSLGANIDGLAPDFTGECPEFTDTKVTALGCGGEIGVRFLDDEGVPVAIESGMQIHVFEFGGNCSTGSVDDEYDVILCSDTNAVVNNNDTTSCTDNLGGGAGETTLNI